MRHSVTHLEPEGGGRLPIRNFSIHLEDSMLSQRGKPQSKRSLNFSKANSWEFCCYLFIFLFSKTTEGLSQCNSSINLKYWSGIFILLPV
jgi:hypothetical protein